MGGKAFAPVLPAGALPRVPPKVYEALKTAIEPRLRQLFGLIGTPAEAPEKSDYGDVDFIAAEPRDGLSHEDIKQALGAELSIPMEGNRTSHYGVPLTPAQMELVREHSKEELADQLYYQVDVHVCADRAEWDRIMFFHAYGDLGMILGILARGVGLQLGTNSLKTSSQPLEEDFPASFLISMSFDAIIPFLGLSMDRWKQGFATQAEVFDWVLTSRFYDARAIKDPAGKRNQRKDRTMYQTFLQYAFDMVKDGRYPAHAPLPNEKTVQQEALEAFGKLDEFEKEVAQRRLQRRIRATFPSRKVCQWTGLDMEKDWRLVKRLMDLVRAEMGGESVMVDRDEKEIQAITLGLVDEARRQITEEWEASQRKRASQEETNLAIAVAKAVVDNVPP